MRAETLHKMCLGKAAYKAWGLAERVRKKRTKAGAKLYIYSCPICLYFHLAKQIEPVKVQPQRPVKEVIKQKPRKFGRHAQWCIDNCLKYPDVPLQELKKMARREIAREDLKASIKRDIEWKRIARERAPWLVGAAGQGNPEKGMQQP
jgi:hypothetical protein